MKSNVFQFPKDRIIRELKIIYESVALGYPKQIKRLYVKPTGDYDWCEWIRYPGRDGVYTWGPKKNI
jgi:hypothetical protein